MQAVEKLFIRVHPTQMLAVLVAIEGVDILEHPTLTRAPSRTVPTIEYVENFYEKFLKDLPSWRRTRACTKPVAGSRIYHRGRSSKLPVGDLIFTPVPQPLEQLATEFKITGVLI